MDIKIFNKYKIIPDDHNIYVLHAGRNKCFLADFFATQSVFLDIPSVDLSAEEPEGKKAIERYHRTLQKGSAFAHFHKFPDRLIAPPNDVEKYHPKLGLQDPNYKRMDGPAIAAVTELYYKAKTGDLVIVPGRGYQGNVLIGEIGPLVTTKNGKIKKTPVSEYHGVEIAHRPVKWLSTYKARVEFSPEFGKILGLPRKLVKLPESLKFEAYDYAYEEYVYNQGASIRIEVLPVGDQSKGIDPVKLRKATDLVVYLNALYNALGGNIDEFSRLSMSEAIDSEFYAMGPLTIEYEIHSPGDVIFRAHDFAKRLIFTSVLAALLSTGVSAEDLYSDTDVNISSESVWSEVEDCDIDVADSVRAALNFLGAEKWEALCDSHKSYSDSIEFNINTDVEVSTGSASEASTPVVAEEAKLNDHETQPSGEE